MPYSTDIKFPVTRKTDKRISGDTFLTLVEGILARRDSRWQHIKNSDCKHGPIKCALLEK